MSSVTGSLPTRPATPLSRSGIDRQIDHSGSYLGLDDGGHHRFISSRSQTDGPTMGDLSGVPILYGTGYWPDRWLTARRIVLNRGVGMQHGLETLLGALGIEADSGQVL